MTDGRATERSPWFERDGIVALLFVAAALAIRAIQFGNPVVQIDEQFYLLTGDRLLHGVLPYTDIWDRKPVGLFLIYAAIRLLGGDGIWQYQLVATAFAAATAFLIHRAARRIAPPLAAVVAGLLYLIYLMANGGDGGQAPVFYNLLVVGAALSVLRAIERPAFDRTAVGLGCAAMLLIGVAIQIKYTVLFEGVYFGLVLLALAWRGGHRAAIVAIASAWVALALLPTAAALLGYALLGHLPDFLFANFQSIFLRPTSVNGDAAGRLIKIAVHTLPLGVAALAGSLVGVDRGDVANRRFIAIWAAVAVAALLGFGTYHDHYALALLPPLAIAAAPVLGVRGWRTAATGVVAVLGIGLATQIVLHNRAWRGTGSDVAAMVEHVRSRPGTLFVFSGDPILYHLTGSALPTRWSFPTLLSESRDIGTMQVDQVTELTRIMAQHPRYVVARDYPFGEASPAAWRMMSAILAREYAPVIDRTIAERHAILYERRE